MLIDIAVCFQLWFSGSRPVLISTNAAEWRIFFTYKPLRIFRGYAVMVLVFKMVNTAGPSERELRVAPPAPCMIVAIGFLV